MGEAIITSRSAAQEEAVPVVPGYHTVLVTLRDYQGKLLKDYPINCKDGDSWYNYKTNETGKALFTCNSGKANISVNNMVDGYRYLDFPNYNMNCDCPIGGQTRLAFNIPKTTTLNFSFGPGTSQIRFLHNQECSGYIVGGGGGGSYYSGGWVSSKSAGGGGGYLNYINNCTFKANDNISIVVGWGGRGGTDVGKPGNTGGTSYISNYSYSANGGQGGNTTLGRGGIGFGNGAYSEGRWSSYPQISKFIAPTNSGSSIAGGGGGAAAQPLTSDSSNSNYVKGYPFGGFPAYGSMYGPWSKATSGSNPGGGGAGSCTDGGGSWSNCVGPGGNGGSGICKLNMINY